MKRYRFWLHGGCHWCGKTWIAPGRLLRGLRYNHHVKHDCPEWK